MDAVAVSDATWAEVIELAACALDGRAVFNAEVPGDEHAVLGRRVPGARGSAVHGLVRVGVELRPAGDGEAEFGVDGRADMATSAGVVDGSGAIAGQAAAAGNGEVGLRPSIFPTFSAGLPALFRTFSPISSIITSAFPACIFSAPFSDGLTLLSVSFTSLPSSWALI